MSRSLLLPASAPIPSPFFSCSHLLLLSTIFSPFFPPSHFLLHCAFKNRLQYSLSSHNLSIHFPFPFLVQLQVFCFPSLWLETLYRSLYLSILLSLIFSTSAFQNSNSISISPSREEV